MKAAAAEFHTEPLSAQVRRAVESVEAARFQRRLEWAAGLLAADLLDANARADASHWSGLLAQAERLRAAEAARAARHEERSARIRADARRLRQARSNCRLTAHHVRQIRRRLDAGESVKDVAGRFRVSMQTVRDIKYRRTWKEVQ